MVMIMENVIQVENLTFKYNKSLFKDFNLNVKEGEWLTIIGNNGSGKSTLLKVLIGLYKGEGTIKMNGIVINQTNYKEIRKEVGVVLENADNQFIAETVRKNLSFVLENLNWQKKDINQRINELAEEMNLTDILDCTPYQLNNSLKQRVIVAGALILKPKILILDEAFDNIDYSDKAFILQYLKNLNETSGLTIINMTHNAEESLYGHRLIIIDKGAIVLDQDIKNAFNDEKIFNRLGLPLPFIVNLSKKLKYYGLVDELMFDMEEVIDKIWR